MLVDVIHIFLSITYLETCVTGKETDRHPAPMENEPIYDFLLRTRVRGFIWPGSLRPIISFFFPEQPTNTLSHFPEKEGNGKRVIFFIGMA